MGDYLQLSPPELKFRFELRKNIPVTLSLHNPGTERVAFKVQLTATILHPVLEKASTQSDVANHGSGDGFNRQLLRGNLQDG